jgi:multiple sugar transport system substrate-binding protein
MEVIKLMTSEAEQKTRFLDGGFLPARPAVFDDSAIQQKYPYAKQAQASFEILKPRPVTPFYPEMSKNAIQPAFGEAMARKLTAEQAIKQMGEKMRTILKG